MSPRAGAVALVAAGLLAACSSAPKPTLVNGRVEAAAQVNPSVSHRPSPLLVRVYQLRASTAFDAADFMSLYQGDVAALGADVAAREELTLAPGESRPWVRTLAPDVRYVAVFAAYRDLEHARWRAVAPVEAGRPQQVVIRADALAVGVTVTR